MKKSNKLIFIIPAYNEELSILKTVKEIEKHNKANKTNYDYIVINDGSTDNTEKVLRDNNLNHITLVHNLGIGGAVQTGYKYALKHNYDIAVQFDGDGQHDVSYVEKLVEPINNKEANMTIGSRYIENLSEFKSTRLRRLGITIISFFIRLTTKEKIYDTTSGYRAVDKNIIEYFSRAYPVEYPEPVSTVEVLKKKYKIKEVAVSMNERENGISSIRAWKDAYYMMNVCLSIILIWLRRSE